MAPGAARGRDHRTAAVGRCDAVPDCRLGPPAGVASAGSPVMRVHRRDRTNDILVDRLPCCHSSWSRFSGWPPHCSPSSMSLWQTLMSRLNSSSRNPSCSSRCRRHAGWTNIRILPTSHAGGRWGARLCSTAEQSEAVPAVSRGQFRGRQDWAGSRNANLESTHEGGALAR